MNGIYELIKPLTVTLGIFSTTFNLGDKFYKEPNEGVEGTSNYYPFNGGYPIWDRQVDMDKVSKKVEDTTKSKEYYIQKIYSQCEMDLTLNSKPETINQ